MNGWNTIDSFGARPIFRGCSMLLLYFRNDNFERIEYVFSSLPNSSNCFRSRFFRGLVIHLQLVVSRPWYSSDVQTWQKVDTITLKVEQPWHFQELSCTVYPCWSKKKTKTANIPPDFDRRIDGFKSNPPKMDVPRPFWECILDRFPGSEYLLKRYLEHGPLGVGDIWILRKMSKNTVASLYFTIVDCTLRSWWLNSHMCVGCFKTSTSDVRFMVSYELRCSNKWQVKDIGYQRTSESKTILEQKCILPQNHISAHNFKTHFLNGASC